MKLPDFALESLALNCLTQRPVMEKYLTNNLIISYLKVDKNPTVQNHSAFTNTYLFGPFVNTKKHSTDE